MAQLAEQLRVPTAVQPAPEPTLLRAMPLTPLLVVMVATSRSPSLIPLGAVTVLVVPAVDPLSGFADCTTGAAGAAGVAVTLADQALLREPLTARTWSSYAVPLVRPITVRLVPVVAGSVV